jgi:hypothetical protein
MTIMAQHAERTPATAKMNRLRPDALRASFPLPALCRSDTSPFQSIGPQAWS